MLYRVPSATCLGLEVRPVTVEVSVTAGVGIYLVGLPDNAVRESLLRVTTALSACGYRVPGRKIVINLAPADLRKEGSAFDCAIAVGLLAASGQIVPADPERFCLAGELSLDGTLRRIPGALPMAVHGRLTGRRAWIFPRDAAREASPVAGMEIYGVRNLAEAVRIVTGDAGTMAQCRMLPVETEAAVPLWREDLADVRGQLLVRRGLEIAAAGGHNLLMEGPPGAGKSLMARCLASILPPMSPEEALETSMIYSVAGIPAGGNGLMTWPPFRSPHHTATPASLCGGGPGALPGEISLAHNGVLYLDEIAQFSAASLELLRQPLEERRISLSRSRYKVTYPASFMLVGSMNPCPCGYWGEEDGRCCCNEGQVRRYRSRLSGPLLDRIDLQLRVRPLKGTELLGNGTAEPSSRVAERVRQAREIQRRRFAGEPFLTNAGMSPAQIRRYCRTDRAGEAFLERVTERYGLSARGYARILKISRTIADLKGKECVSLEAISEAVQYRLQGMPE